MLLIVGRDERHIGRHPHEADAIDILLQFEMQVQRGGDGLAGAVDAEIIREITQRLATLLVESAMQGGKTG